MSVPGLPSFLRLYAVEGEDEPARSQAVKAVDGVKQGAGGARSTPRNGGMSLFGAGTKPRTTWLIHTMSAIVKDSRAQTDHARIQQMQRFDTL
jgi:hypothetical protein